MVKVTLHVARSNGVNALSRFDVEVANENIRVLDVLVSAREHGDPTLGFRYACRVGMCGSCAMIINGKEALACQTAIASLGTTKLVLEPLRGLPVQHDLMVDITPFFAGIKRLDAAFKPIDPGSRVLRRMPPADEVRAAIEAQNGCITCGACYSACARNTSRGDCPSPAALNRVLMLTLDERDALGRTRLDKVSADDPSLRSEGLGVDFACPQGIRLNGAMTQLRQLAAQNLTAE
jgi:succinate dehydrogenase/fumarate reductase iron-sulfur protein